jgi:hypothetical protein
MCLSLALAVFRRNTNGGKSNPALLLHASDSISVSMESGDDLSMRNQLHGASFCCSVLGDPWRMPTINYP